MTAKSTVIYKSIGRSQHHGGSSQCFSSLPYGSVKHDGAVRQTVFFFIFKKKILKRDFLFENKKENAPLAMGVLSHSKGCIEGFSLPDQYCSTCNSNNLNWAGGITGQPPSALTPSGRRRGLTAAETEYSPPSSNQWFGGRHCACRAGSPSLLRWVNTSPCSNRAGV